MEYPDLASSAQSSRLEIGKPIRSPNLYSSLFERTIKYESINPATGLPNYKDVDGSGTFNNKDY
ncbi:hypothetical protein JZU69_03540, partial [bacterium]|nr:hypothetical protein [bacterium]